ncbi:MAG: hypothetical protein HY508_10520 [Acidobacteria bacterium]|nr:hypothetical protein [Acidobacteriota bacterium]
MRKAHGQNTTDRGDEISKQIGANCDEQNPIHSVNFYRRISPSNYYGAGGNGTLIGFVRGSPIEDATLSSLTTIAGKVMMDPYAYAGLQELSE